METRKAIFLDKDGTLIPDIPYNVDPDKIILSDNAVDGLQKLVADGYDLVVISNQAGIAMNFFKPSAMKTVEERIRFLLQAHGLDLAAFYFCPHHPQASISDYRRICNCRKPANGMLLRAVQRLNVSLKHSWLIGDILHDIEAGNSAGCKTILINNGNETEWNMNDERTPDSMLPNINAAAEYILDIGKLNPANNYGLLESM